MKARISVHFEIRCVHFGAKQKKKTLSNNNIKWGNYSLVILKLIVLQIILQLKNTVNSKLFGVMTLNVSDSACSPI